MTDFLATAAFFITMPAIVSAALDILSHDDRQDAWEKEHPGEKYVRNYRKLTKA